MRTTQSRQRQRLQKLELKCTPSAWGAHREPPSRSTTATAARRDSKMTPTAIPIVTTLDEATLIETARAGNGSYIQAAGGLVNISPILQAMNGMEQAEVATMSYTDYTHHFHWFFIFAVAMLLLEGTDEF